MIHATICTKCKDTRRRRRIRASDDVRGRAVGYTMRRSRVQHSGAASRARAQVGTRTERRRRRERECAHGRTKDGWMETETGLVGESARVCAV